MLLGKGFRFASIVFQIHFRDFPVKKYRKKVFQLQCQFDLVEKEESDPCI